MPTTKPLLTLTKLPVATTAMLIRRPVAEVFAAVVDPAITSKFWFSHGSGRLEPGAQVEWTWEMYGFSVGVNVLEVEENARVAVEWMVPEAPTTIAWDFTTLPDGTFLSITNSGFHGDADAAVAEAIGSTEGFTFVLAGMKAWLEHGIQLNLAADRFPKGLEAE